MLQSQLIFIINKVSFNLECFKNFLPFPSIPFTIPGIQLKEASYWKIITFDSGNYLNMWVTFDVFTCNRMIKLKIASKRSELHCKNRWLIWKLEHLVNAPWLAILMITVCRGNWNVSPQEPLAGTFHITYTVMCYEVALEKCICASRSIVNTVPPGDKNKWFPISMNIWEKLWW